MKRYLHLALAMVVAWPLASDAGAQYNVLFIISDDLTSTALGCYGNTVCKTPHIDNLASEGTRYTRAYCQYPVCGPSRSSLMFGYYPHTTGVFGYVSGRSQNGSRETWSQFFKNRGYYSARCSKIFHMGVPNGIRSGGNGADDSLSWTERFNAQGAEAEDAVPLDPALNGGNPTAERLQGIDEGSSGVNQIIGGNTYEYVIVANDDTAQSDPKSAAKACELIELHKNERFFLAVGFVRPHIPHVAPQKYFDMYPWQGIVPPVVPAGDQSDIIARKVTTSSLKFNTEEKKKAIAAYYATVSFMDDQVGKVLQKLKDEGLEDQTIVVFTSDHGFFLGEHDFWSKQYVHEESSKVPLIIKVPGKAPAVCHSLAELIDLYPTTAELCGLEVPTRLQGKSLAATLDDPAATVRDTAFSIFESNNYYYLRSDQYAFIQYNASGSGGYELYDMASDPLQLTNVASDPAYATTLAWFKQQMVAKIESVNGHRDDHSLWLPFNEGDSTEAMDANGENRGNLVNFAGSVAQWVPGRHNRACLFSGAQQVDVSRFTPPGGTSNRTVSAWIKTTQNGLICHWGNAQSAGQGWSLYINDAGKLSLDGGGGMLTTSSTINDGAWHHVAASWEKDLSPDLSDTRMYVDGQLEVLSQVSGVAINTSASGLTVGGPQIATSASAPGSVIPPFQGVIDEFRVTHEALAPADIVFQYAEQKNSESAWVLQHFGAPRTFDWTADQDMDFKSNLFEYAFGLDPKVQTAGATVHQATLNPATRKLEVTFPKRIDGTHSISYTVQVSRDMVDWSLPFTVTATGPTVSLDNSRFEQLTVATDGTLESENRLFVRVFLEQ
ncbi:MAG: sulfatase-like hydrolase/transferase [Akkermansiaceae bacterium]|nr:sulfatase-like hydrolase/transferase [Akkermansiaceae bacterium]